MPAAVDGMNCAMPSAPAELTTDGSNRLSWYSSALSSEAGMPLEAAACSIVWTYWSGTATFPIWVDPFALAPAAGAGVGVD